MRYSMEVEFKSQGFYGPYDVFVGGVFVGQRRYSGHDYSEMAQEFIAGLGRLVVRNLGDDWSVDRAEDEDY